VLDSDTRRKIDTLRNILVGKIPNPQTQVEQITTGLIYKFMDDMDQESIEMGGKGSFFVGDYEKYAWKNLLDPKLSGVDKVNLYSQAIESMYLNPSAPQLFRDIFKNAFLPFKDPSTLNMFLKEINEFHYSHSEKLGDAFEYLISIMGSQGDAGQFRTPRHIIDFIVEIIDPQKNETILDPACGTAGFLISSYKHILKTNTDKKLGDKLSAEDKKKVGENVTGYDISPEMIRLSLVNMYLHGFSTPKIDEYDTLSSEDKWNEYFDVILANPPFFSPKGGIQPHKRFGVESKKAEVLFTSYILEHLKPNGRSGIIVPEGIIFQSTTKAYIELRKQLIENALIGVISLPQGVFNPYSGVKTSILILDKKLNKERDSIFFAEIKNDGFSLGAQRNELDTSDLPKLSKDIVELNQNELIKHLKKQTLLENKDFSLDLSRYIEAPVHNGIYDFVQLSEVSSISNGYAFKSKEMRDEINTGDLPVLKIGNITMDGNISEKSIQFHKVENNLEKFIVSSKDIVIAMTGATVGKVAEIKTGKYLLNQRVGCLRSNKKINRNYLRFLLISNKFYNFCQMGAVGGAQGNISSSDLEEYKIPLPPLEVQQEIVYELEGYQTIIEGCKQVVENYKPTIDIDPSWEMVELGEVCEINKESEDPKNIFKDEFIYVDISSVESKTGKVDLSNILNIKDYPSRARRIFKKGDILLSSVRPNLQSFAFVDFDVENYIASTGFMVLSSNKDKIQPQYLYSILFSDTLMKQMVSKMQRGQYPSINQSDTKGLKLPLPNLDTQKEIVQKIEEERTVIEGNKKLIEIYTHKIQERINKVWGEG
jgi:type I restriction enzyme M protein